MKLFRHCFPPIPFFTEDMLSTGFLILHGTKIPFYSYKQKKESMQ